jgi:hypothetical protein
MNTNSKGETMAFQNRNIVAAAIAALSAAACGSSANPANVTANAVSQGTIQRFGSIFVNGVEWRTQGATLRTPDDSTAQRTLQSETEIRGVLHEGEEASVKGRLDADGKHGQATEIETHSRLAGVVADHSGAGDFTVGGVKVSTDAATRHYDASGAARADASDGDDVLVSGVPDDKGGLRATAVKARSGADGQTEAKGYVLAGAGSNFSLAFTPGGAAFVTVIGGSFAAPAPSALVEVKGTSNGATPVPAITLTRAAQIEDELKGDALFESEVEGIVQPGGNLAVFTVNGTRVTTSASTTYVGIPSGSSPSAEFAVGIKVEVEGTVAMDGTLAAAKIKLKEAARLAGTVTNVAAGTFDVLGAIHVVADSSTDIRIDSAAALANGAFVEVRGYPRADGKVYAQQVRVRSAGGGNQPFLQGVISAKSSPTLVIMGMTVTTGATTQYQVDDDSSVDAGATGQSAFFNAIISGQTIVKLKWPSGAGVTAVAAEAELENQDG